MASSTRRRVSRKLVSDDEDDDVIGPKRRKSDANPFQDSDEEDESAETLQDAASSDSKKENMSSSDDEDLPSSQEIGSSSKKKAKRIVTSETEESNDEEEEKENRSSLSMKDESDDSKIEYTPTKRGKTRRSLRRSSRLQEQRSNDSTSEEEEVEEEETDEEEARPRPKRTPGKSAKNLQVASAMDELLKKRQYKKQSDADATNPKPSTSRGFESSSDDEEDEAQSEEPEYNSDASSPVIAISSDEYQSGSSDDEYSDNSFMESSDSEDEPDSFLEAMDEIKKNLGRGRDSDLQNRDKYLDTFYNSPSPKKKSPKDKPNKPRVDKDGKIDYQALINGLRPFATREDMTDLEILDEWRLYATAESKECEGVCVCGETGLRYLSFMQNINIEDVIDRATTIICIGSICRYRFHGFRQDAKDIEMDAPEVLFQKFHSDGITATFRGRVSVPHKVQKKCKKGKTMTKTVLKHPWKLTFKSKDSEYLANNAEEIANDYNLRMDARDEGVVDLYVFPPGPKKKNKFDIFKKAKALKRDGMYRFFLKSEVNEFVAKAPLPLDFHVVNVTDLNDKRKKPKSSAPKGKDFIQN